ncbi:Phosphomethylpyrimidine kinase-domain-containing protein [Pyronema omphalodes]|nr:Phosphomethylpyrimidine kinase-domain-containing protein [Pyronema omphalodes]
MAAKLPTVLTIAGSDPSGGAGIEADLKVITAHNCYGMTTITALTAQNTTGVRDIHFVPKEFVQKSLEAVFEDMPVDVVKTGMLGSAGTIGAVATILKKYNVTKIVIDPVMVSTSGSKLIPDDAIEILQNEILPRTYILTPNIPEALVLLKKEDTIKSVDDMKALAAELGDMGPKYIYLKGGHVPMMKNGARAVPNGTAEVCVDILYNSVDKHHAIIEKPFIDSKNTHGTGCSLASAIASNLAKGLEPLEAVKNASNYISNAISTAPNYGKGHGPLNHMKGIPFAPDRFLDYLLDHPKIKSVWKDFTHHDFVKRLGAGTLDKDQFCYYLKQDYLFLIQFCRAHSLAGSKATTMEDAAASARTVQLLYDESRLHIEYCAGFGLSQADVEATEEDVACTSYTRYVLDIGHTDDVLALNVAMAPCLFGYHEIGKWLLKSENTKHGKENPYYDWILTYASSDSYVESVRLGRKILEEKVRSAGPERVEELVDIFYQATKLERGFWDMGLRAGKSV